MPDIDEDELNEIYPFASAKSKQDEVFKETARQVTAQLQKHKPGIYDLWKKIMEVSIDSVKRNYLRLDVSFDLWYGESDADPFIPELIDILTEKGLLHESEGAMVVDVQEEGDKITVPPIIVTKSNKSVGYDATDIATIIQRQRDFQPARIWYVVDKRQSLHFTQVFRCAKKAGLVPAETELKLLGFGTMNGSDGKPFKTRDGGVMRLSDLIQTAIDGAMEKLADSEYVQSGKLETAEKIGMAAIKFGDLSNQPSKDYIFDLNKFLAFDGKTAHIPFVHRNAHQLDSCKGGYRPCGDSGHQGSSHRRRARACPKHRSFGRGLPKGVRRYGSLRSLRQRLQHSDSVLAVLSRQQDFKRRGRCQARRLAWYGGFGKESNC